MADLRSNLQRLVNLGIVEMGKEGNGETGRLMFSIPVLPSSVELMTCSEGAHEKFWPVSIRYTFHDMPVEAVVEWVEGKNN